MIALCTALQLANFRHR